MKYFIFIITIIFSLVLGSCKEGQNKTLQQSNKGVHVLSDMQVSQDVLDKIDRDLDELFSIARILHPEWDSTFGLHDTYVIEIVPSSPRCMNPAYTENIDFRNNAENWDYCSRYDVNSDPDVCEICVAGRFLDNGRIITTVRGILSSPIVRYEGEHKLLREASPIEYERTKFHSAGTGHPLLSIPQN